MTTVLRRSAVAAGIGLCALLSGAPARAESIRFLAVFGSEAAGATGTGSSIAVFDTSAQTLSISAVWDGLTTPTTVAHIHCCVAAPGTVGVAVSAPSLPGFPGSVGAGPGVTSGSYSVLVNLAESSAYGAGFRNANGGTAASARAALFDGLRNGTAYFNVHSAQFPGGEIGGFYREVPEPATLGRLGLATAAVGALGLARRGARRAAVQRGA